MNSASLPLATSSIGLSAPVQAYRPDIDGLRAVAVLSVIGYHFFPGALQAGFVGVDIFFVISGYLISRNIRAGLERGTFSVWDFYGRRARRIFPALILVLLASMAIGWGVLYSDEYAQLGTHTAAGAAFFSNFVLWRESGYFDIATEAKPLMHLWSLAVEEQFYLLWPLAMIRFHGRSGLLAIVAIFVASLLLGVLAGGFSPAGAFYLPICRFWELMAGALLACLPGAMADSPSSARLRSWLGLALLVASYGLIHSGLSFPGWWALLPVLAAALLISAGPGAPFNRWVLSNRVAVAIGLISFPLYLWHWPLLSFWKIVTNAATPGPAQASLLVLATFVLAWLSYRWVEKPLRHAPQPAVPLALAGVLLLVGLLGWTLQARNGWPERAFGPRYEGPLRNHTGAVESTLDDCRLDAQAAALFQRCKRDARGPERHALLGDSKAEALFPGLVRTSQADGRWLFIGGAQQHGSLVTLLSDDRNDPAPAQVRARTALKAVIDNPRIENVVLVVATRNLFILRSETSIADLPAAQPLPLAMGGLGRYARAIADSGKQVVLLVDNPSLPEPRLCVPNPRVSLSGPVAVFFSIAPHPECTLALTRHRALAARYHQLLQEVAQSNPAKISVFDTTPYLCDAAADLCPTHEGRKSLYSYGDHISEYAAARIGQGLNEHLRQRRRP